MGGHRGRVFQTLLPLTSHWSVYVCSVCTYWTAVTAYSLRSPLTFANKYGATHMQCMHVCMYVCMHVCMYVLTVLVL
jgi:hypothetical protein